MLKKVDPEDVLQSVFRSFFEKNKEGMLDLRDWDSLWSLLAVLTLRKCGQRVRYFRAARRDVRRELATAPIGEVSAEWEVVANEPTPDHAAVLAKTFEQLMDALSVSHRQIVSLRLKGIAPADIAKELECSERTVQRVLDQVKQWLERQQEDNEGPIE